MLTCLPVSDRNNAQPYPYFNLQAVDNAYRQCRKRKRKTVSACLYETKLLDYTINSKNALQNLCWQPTPPIAFVVTKPKAREVYAAQFEDRVIHHLLINELEVLLDSQFIFDAASNRKNKGTHFAVNRLQKTDAKIWVKLGNPQDFNKVSRHKRLTELVPGKGT